MSYSVVFVEDEQIVREEIVSSIRWDLLGLELVGTASDGMSGENLIKEKKNLTSSLLTFASLLRMDLPCSATVPSTMPSSSPAMPTSPI